MFVLYSIVSLYTMIMDKCWYEFLVYILTVGECIQSLLTVPLSRAIN